MSLLGRIGTGLIASATNLNDAHTRAQIPVTLTTRQPSAEQLADALLASLKLSAADRTAYQQTNGVDLRDQLIAEFQEKGINHSTLEYAGNGKYRAYVGMPKETHQQLVQWSKTDTHAPPEATGAVHARQQELRDRGAHTRHQLELKLRTAEAKQQIADSVTSKGGAQIANGVMGGLAKAAPLTLPEAMPLAVGGAMIAATAAPLTQILDGAINQQVESWMKAPPPPLTANETDTKTKPSVPDIGDWPTAGPLVPTSQPVTPTTTSAPDAPHGTPQGEPPRSEPPRFDHKRGIPTALATASLGKLAADVVKSEQVNQPSRTQPSGVGELTGRPERIRPNDDEATRQGIEAENHAAQVLADAGYKVQHGTKVTAEDVAKNPILKIGKTPDYRIEGEIFDCYSPQSRTPVENILDTLRRKAASGQATRFVVNLDNHDMSLDELKQALIKRQAAGKPIEGLQEIILVKGDNVTQLFPFE